jgi:hypothetical protein
VLWAVLDRWEFADADGWAQLLADALEDVPEAADGRRIADELRPKLRGLAESETRLTLAAADELHRGVEFLADLAAFAGTLPSPLAGEGSGVRGREDHHSPLTPHHFSVRGLIDFLYRDADGWHVLGIDRGTSDEDDPWRGRRPGLVLQAWAARGQLGEWPASVGLFDLAAGQLVRADPRKVKPAAVAGRFGSLLETWRPTSI